MRYILTIILLTISVNAHAFGLWDSADIFGVGGVALPALSAQKLALTFDGPDDVVRYSKTTDYNTVYSWNPETGVLQPTNFQPYSAVAYALVNVFEGAANTALHSVSFKGTGSVAYNGTGATTLNGTGANDRVESTWTATAETKTFTPSGDVREMMVTRGSARAYYETMQLDRKFAPRMVTGKFGKAVYIEPGSTNLFKANNTFLTYVSSLGLDATTPMIQTGTYYGDLQEIHIKEDSAVNTYHQVSQTITQTAAATTYTFSALFNPTSTRPIVELWIRDPGAANGVHALFNITTGTIVETATAFGGFTAVNANIRRDMNGLYMCSLTATTTAIANVVADIWGSTGTHAAGTFPTYTGSGKLIKVVAPQLEAQKHETSRIITDAYTRPRPTESLRYATGNSLLSASAGAWAAWVYVRPTVQSSDRAAYILGHKNTNNIIALYHNAVANQWTAETTNNAGTSSKHTVTNTLSEGWHLIGMQWSSTELSIWIDGVKQASPQASPNLPASLASYFYIGSDGSGTDGTQLSMPIDTPMVFNRELTSSEWLRMLTANYTERSPLYFVAWGDSMTAGNLLAFTDYPSKLETALTNRRVVNKGQGSRTASELAAKFIREQQHNDKAVHIIWYGTNNMADPQQTLDAVASVVSRLPSNRYLVLSVYNGANYSGSNPTLYNGVLTANAALAAAYPNNYLDVRTYMVHNCGTHTGQDATDEANDVVPISCRPDTLHFSEAANVILANYIASYIAAKGW